MVALNPFFRLTQRRTFSLRLISRIWGLRLVLSHVWSHSILHHVEVWRWLARICRLVSFLLVLTIESPHIAANHALIVHPMLVLLHLLALLGLSKIKRIRLDVLSLYLASKVLLFQWRTHSLRGWNRTTCGVGLMSVVILTKYLTSILNWVCIRYWIYMAILTDHICLLFASPYTILGLSSILGIVVVRIILILEVISLIVLLRTLILSITVPFRHIISHHVSPRIDQFGFSPVLGLVNAIRSNAWARFDTLLSQSFLIHARVDQLTFYVLLPLFVGLHAAVLHHHGSLLVWISTVGRKDLLLLILIHRRSASWHRRQILLRSHFNRLYLLLLSLLLVHRAIVALVRQLRFNQVHLRTELRCLLELVLSNTHSSFVHLALHVALVIRVYLFFWISMMQRRLYICIVVKSVCLPPLRPNGCVNKGITLVRINKRGKVIWVNHSAALILDFAWHLHSAEWLEVIRVASSVCIDPWSLVVILISLIVTLLLPQLHDHLLLLVMLRHLLNVISMISLRYLRNLRSMIWG